ncbi:MAG: hypothetical protein GY906_24840 [bacterium]|nr:hypothetical protein [bacterium]
MRVRSWTGLMLIVGCALGTLGSNCGGPEGTVPSPVAPEAVAPTSQDVTPTAVGGGAGDTWTKNGLKVTVVYDEWGPGSCHKNGGLRRFLLENQSNVKKYSRLSAFNDDQVTCATQQTPTGTPNHGGCTEVEPGKSCEYWVRVTLPKGSDGVCTVQVDDSWGPGGIPDSSFVVGDSFSVDQSKCKKICVEDPKETVKCSEWKEGECERTKVCTKTIDYKCKPDPEPETWTEREGGDWRGRYCVTYLSNTGSDYRVEDDGSIWKSGLSLNRGQQNTCWSHAIDNSNLCLWWRNEKIDCERAKCGDIEASWHGNTTFRCECVLD